MQQHVQFDGAERQLGGQAVCVVIVGCCASCDCVDPVCLLLGCLGCQGNSGVCAHSFGYSFVWSYSWYLLCFESNMTPRSGCSFPSENELLKTFLETEFGKGRFDLVFLSKRGSRKRLPSVKRKIRARYIRRVSIRIRLRFRSLQMHGVKVQVGER
jgi:hypothetical protein